MLNMSVILPLTLSSAAVAVSLLSCSHALRSAFRQSRNGKARDQFYQDDDGCASPRSLAEFTNRGAKSFIVVFSAIGAATCIANLVITTLYHDGVESVIEPALILAAWVRLSLTQLTHLLTSLGIGFHPWHLHLLSALTRQSSAVGNLVTIHCPNLGRVIIASSKIPIHTSSSAPNHLHHFPYHQRLIRCRISFRKYLSPKTT